MTPIQHLSRLDKSSPRFPSQIIKVLQGTKYKDWVNNLHGEHPSWLVNYLDHVLDTLQHDTPAFHACLRELRSICGHFKILPQSHLLPATLSNVTEHPVATRGPCDVYEAFLEGSKVWVKRLRMYSLAGPKDVDRDFFQEVVVWKRLAHPNIVPLLGVTIAPFQSVSLWIPGGELLEFLSSHPDVDRFSLLSDIADGLNYLHSHNVIHGDLKGSSIIVDNTGLARLTDFNFSRIVSDRGSAASMTDGHSVRWAAPEVLYMERPVTEASDVYSFAMIIVEMFTGRPPFYDSTPTTVIIDVLSGCRPERPTDPNLTDDLWNITNQCWNHDARRRPRIAEVVVQLRTAFPSQYGDRISLDGMTLGVFARKESSFEGPYYRPSRLAATSRKLRRFCGFSEASAPNKVLGPLDNTSSLPRRNRGGWFSGCSSNFQSNCYD